MSPRLSLCFAAAIAGTASAAFAWFVRLPLPFDGFAALTAFAFAGLGTLCLVAWLPTKWVWTETETLRHAFQARHGITEYAADSALQTITTVHQRANSLRGAAKKMRPDVAEHVSTIADRLDASAREIFYEPEQHRALRAVLIRSELIEDAARAHAALRARRQTETEQASREKLLNAINALDEAFDQTDLHVARRLLHEVEAASDVAETLLKPRKT